MAKINLEYSSDMLTNYLQAEVIAPQKKFSALQSSDGQSLLFSISSDGVLFLTEERSGQLATGWQRTDLSGRTARQDFSGREGIACRTFEAAQSVVDNTVGLAMALCDGNHDHLYLSLGNSSRDLSWSEKPNWQAYPFDATGNVPDRVVIQNILFAETTGSSQYIIVDILRDPDSGVKEVSRYYIDPAKSGGAAWIRHDVPIDLQADSYSSCIGRLPGGYVDGVYSAGHAGNSGQLVFVPVINVFGDGPPLPVRLGLPGLKIASAITAARNPDQSSNLFAVSGNTLYLFAAEDQKDGATGQALVTHEVLADARRLSSMTHGGITTLWGLNASNEVFYLSCETGNIADAAGWSIPVPLLTGIEQMSAYLNLDDGGNTIFASGGNRLQRIVQDTATASRLWQSHEIRLKAAASQKATSFTSYTTTLQITDAQGLPARDVQISLSTANRTPVYINGLYYVTGPTPVHVQADALGAVTIIEATPNLNGSIFTVTAGGGQNLTINPMEKPFHKLASLDTKDKLSAARVKQADGSATPLVPAGTSDDDLKTVASCMQNLGKSYQALNSPAAAMKMYARPMKLAVVSPRSLGDVGQDIAIAAGDLFNWLKSGVKAFVHVVEDAATGLWHFVAKIAGKVYRAVLDTVGAVVGAAEWLFNTIKTGIEDLIRFIEFLFEWDDIKRTKQVLHNLVKRYMEGEVENIRTFRSELDKQIGEVERSISDWADISDWSGLGKAAAEPANNSASNPVKGQTSGSQLLAHHFQNHASDLTVVSGSPTLSLLQELVNDLINALKNEAHVLEDIYQQLVTLAKDFASLSVTEVIKRLAGILADGVLSSAQVVADTLLDILYQVGSTAVKVFDSKIHIPVISDILNAIGIPDISFLDLFTWIAAVAYTVVYKIANDKAPFPDDQHTSLLINASGIDELKSLFSAAPRSVGAAQITLPESVRDSVFVFGHAVGGFTALMSDFVTTFEAAEESGENPFAIPSAVLGGIKAFSIGATNFLVPKDGLQNTAVSWVSRITSSTTMIAKIIFSGPLQKKFAASEGVMKGLAVGDGRATGAIINAILVIPALACTGYHFYELSGEKVDAERTAAILDEVSSLTSYISRLSYTVAVNDEDPESKAIAIGVMAVANVGTAGLQTAEALTISA